MSKYSKQIVELQIAFLRALKAAGKPLTVDAVTEDLRARFDVPNAPWRGMALVQLQREKLIERVEYTRSKRPSRHANTVCLWRLASVADAALKITALAKSIRKKKTAAAQ